MKMTMTCSHVAVAENIPISTLLNIKELICSDCDCRGPNLWICLHKNCLRIGCAEKSNDHSTLHNVNNPSHCVHMNLSTNRIWCYECKREVFMYTQSYDSDQEVETYTARSKDSGHGSYSTLRTNTPERVSGPVLDRAASLTVGMSGDGSDSSEGDVEEDYPDYAQERPCGLVGLQNIGNTCYMNAALQALSNTKPLTKFFLECSYMVHLLSDGKKPGLSRTYQALMRDIWIKNITQGYVSPSGILYGIRNVHAMFRGYQQHDTQEFLRNFMDQLHEELKQVAPFEPPMLSSPNWNSGNPDADTFSLAMEEPISAPFVSSGYDSSEGEYETCDSGVSERSSLSDDTERPPNNAKRRLSRCGSPNRRQRQRLHSNSVIDSQPTTSKVSNNKKQPKYRSIISDIFDGKLLSSVQCLTCDRISSRIETFQDLSLPIPSKDHLVVLHGRTSVQSTGVGATCSEALMPVQDGWVSWIWSWFRSWFYGPTVTLHDCLAAFFSTDELKGDNMYSCEKCNKLRNGIKFSKVLQLPEVLCIHLKRFRHELMFSSKISSVVSFPLKGLEMRPYLHTDCVSKVSSYELFSVICHHGTAGGGHYTCFALNSGQWYEFDDQYVTKVSPDKVQSCEAYVLFYQKVSTTADVVRDAAERILESTPETRIGESVKRTYISRQWTNRFYYCAEPGAIDNSDFLCQHGAVDPEHDIDIHKIAMVVPYDVYQYLHSRFGGCPPFTDLTVCPACLAMQNRLLYEMETFLQVSREAQALTTPQTHYMSTSWYTQWHNFVQKRTREPPGPIDNSKIDPEQLDLEEAAEVPESLWKFFHNIYGGGPEIRITPTDLTESPNFRTKYPENVDSEESIPDVVDKRSYAVKGRENWIKEDKSVYGQGEPIEIRDDAKHEDSINEDAKELGNNVENNVEMSVEDDGVVSSDSVKMPNNYVDNLSEDTEKEEKEKAEVRPHKRHRRRRKN
ncbi:ubiquitin carboxyl-terminal hydrolase 20 isoform X2 [Diorhabda carinulata]|uniref:ubiquitin carboxyl-terminal hydrolase 20 isoform X2 n=2 Tax=Diorhabda carinulata TaxID=1163345 RepID=UPI0025A19759|nr:ubiquitin carboxyl-terminal hydrolase 20 isoform X2 [Diorhabda carinulata]